MREAVPGLNRLAIMLNVGYPVAVQEMGEVQAAARTLGIEVASVEIRRAEDIAPAFAALAVQGNTQTGALYVVGNSLFFTNRTNITSLALNTRLSAIFSDRYFVEAGGLMSYGPNFPDLFGVPPNWSTRSARRKARRYSGRAADQVRARRQSQDRQGNRANDSRNRSSPAPTR